MVEVMFNGPDGKIEGRYTQSERKDAPAALILHPHPLHGGSMNNKVVYNLFKDFVLAGFSTLRFNFRGIGRSQGNFDNGAGELTDAATALDWLQLQNPDSSNFWVAGFSFGSWIAMQLLMRRPEIQGFVIISPPVEQCDFTFLSPCPASGLIIQGDNDSVVDERSVAELVDRLSRQRNSDLDYQIIFGADHFFRDKLDDLNEIVSEYLRSRLTNDRVRNIRVSKKRRMMMAEV